MTEFDDLPVIKLRRTPTDAELERQRDKEYRKELRRFLAGKPVCCNLLTCDCNWPPTEVEG